MAKQGPASSTRGPARILNWRGCGRHFARRSHVTRPGGQAVRIQCGHFPRPREVDVALRSASNANESGRRTIPLTSPDCVRVARSSCHHKLDRATAARSCKGNVILRNNGFGGVHRYTESISTWSPSLCRAHRYVKSIDAQSIITRNHVYPVTHFYNIYGMYEFFVLFEPP